MTREDRVRLATDALNALPFDVRRDIIGSMQVGSEILIGLDALKTVCALHRHSETEFTMDILSQRDVAAWVLKYATPEGGTLQ